MQGSVIFQHGMRLLLLLILGARSPAGGVERESAKDFMFDQRPLISMISSYRSIILLIRSSLIKLPLDTAHEDGTVMSS